MLRHGPMVVIVRVVIGVVLCLAASGALAADVAQIAASPPASPVSPAAPPVSPATSPVTLFNIFLRDGSTVVSYGEYARLAEEVVFSMPLGVSDGEARLQLITLPSGLVDWPRTEQYAASVRYRRYAETYGESDFAALTAEVTATLNEIAATTDRQRALAIADEARRMLVQWPALHYGYRQSEISDIVGLIDEATSGLAPARGAGSFQLSLVAMAPVPTLQPPLGMPTPREQVTRLVTLVSSIPRAADRIALLRSALAIIDHPGSGITAGDAVAVRRSLEAQLREEIEIDARYAKVSERLMASARRAAASASVSAVERVLARVDAEDAQLGSRRPETVQALRAALTAELAAVRDLRLRRDQWLVLRDVYRDYLETVSVLMVQLVKAQSSLDAIRRLAGPSPRLLESLKGRLSGGADRLQKMVAPDSLRSTHELLVGAWRFAESATETRYRAIVSADLPTAWQASSAAAGSLMLLERAQEEIRLALEPPRLR